MKKNLRTASLKPKFMVLIKKMSVKLTKGNTGLQRDAELRELSELESTPKDGIFALKRI